MKDGHALRRAIRVTCLAVGLLVLLPMAGADASGAVRITAAYYDPANPAGTPTNAQLNAEYIVVRNSSTTNRTVTAWTLRDLARPNTPAHVYTFPTFTLGAGKSVRIHTGKGSKSSTDLYWGLTYYVWGDDSDTATLKNKAGTTMSTCSWTTSDTSPKFC